MLIFTLSLVIGVILLTLFALEYKLEKGKRAAEKSPPCFHTYMVYDIREHITPSIDAETIYCIACVHCGTRREVDSYELETLRSGGLLQECGTIYEEIKADFEKLEKEDRKNRYCHNQDELREVMISNWKEKQNEKSI